VAQHAAWPAPEMADEFMARIIAGETIRDLTNPAPVVDPTAPYIPPIVSADHFGASGLEGQYGDLVKIQRCAASSLGKSPTWESGP
jgi:hypothetical protein